MSRMIEYWFESKPKSTSMPPIFALPMLARSRYDRVYKTQMVGTYYETASAKEKAVGKNRTYDVHVNLAHESLLCLRIGREDGCRRIEGAIRPVSGLLAAEQHGSEEVRGR
jgi:hypothetical protein